MESELFGHEKGAFTGADKRSTGRFEQANGGTLFLDEIGDLLPSLQVKLLRALQEKTIERLGASAPVRVDFRLVCATHQNLKSLVQSGKFREDLFYRINVVPVKLPALRERPEDIEPLAQHFLSTLCEKAPKRFSDEALQALKAFHWPGNVRQLRNAVEYALVLCKSEAIGPGDRPAELRSSPTPGRGTPMVVAPPAAASETIPSAAPLTGLKDSVKEAEADLIRSTLEKNHWRMSKVAGELKISRSTLYQRMKIYGIKKP